MKLHLLQPLATPLSDSAPPCHSTQLEGVYVVKKLLQRAIFGEVLLVQPSQCPGALVVLKAVSKQLVDQGIGRKGCKVFEDHIQELAVLKKVREMPHPHLLGLAADELQFENDSTRYVALPYLAGGELFRMVEAQGPLDANYARVICRGVASALDHLHSRLGYAHNDVSLENILLTETGSPVLCDFGLAHPLGRPWDPRRRFSGKLPYKAPEIHMGTVSRCSAEADIFSLGVTLFILLVGIPPFDLPDPRRDQRYAYIQQGRLGELLRLWGKTDLPATVIELMHQMMMHEPQRRITLRDVLAHPWMSGVASSSGDDRGLDMDVDWFTMDMDMEDKEHDFIEEKHVVCNTNNVTPDAQRGRHKPLRQSNRCAAAAEVDASRGKPRSSPESVFSFSQAYLNHTTMDS